MFRSDAQKCQAIRLLLGSLGLEYLWTERGPTAKAVEWLNGSPLSSGENVLLRTAFEFWNQQGTSCSAATCSTSSTPSASKKS